MCNIIIIRKGKSSFCKSVAYGGRTAVLPAGSAAAVPATDRHGTHGQWHLSRATRVPRTMTLALWLWSHTHTHTHTVTHTPLHTHTWPALIHTVCVCVAGGGGGGGVLNSLELWGRTTKVSVLTLFWLDAEPWMIGVRSPLVTHATGMTDPQHWLTD